jgi:succinate dehydrogenase / fumarate reductase, cytochrome b subunit
MSNRNRPLSPHLQIYKWKLHMAMSIFHRATGVLLSIGLIALMWWLMAVATSSDYFALVQSYIAHPIGRFALFGFSISLIYHSLNGIRHLFYDAGMGYDLDTTRNSGWFVMSLTLILTLGIWYLGHHLAGKI